MANSTSGMTTRVPPRNAMRVFLDDYRDPPSSDWRVVRSYDEFVALVRDHLPEIEHIAFDHDLADALVRRT
jgi:hypothetical protein